MPAAPVTTAILPSNENIDRSIYPLSLVELNACKAIVNQFSIYYQSRNRRPKTPVCSGPKICEGIAGPAKRCPDLKVKNETGVALNVTPVLEQELVHGQSAVYRQSLSGYIAGDIGGKVGYGIGYVFRSGSFFKGMIKIKRLLCRLPSFE
jgi:hypothetical protein